MIEYVFRITEAQLANLGGLLATKASDEVLIAECGSGHSSFLQGVTRESWSYKSISDSVRGEHLKGYAIERNVKYCVFSDSEEQLESIAFAAEAFLWAALEGTHLKVYRYEGNLRPVDISLVVGHTLRYTFGRTPILPEGDQQYERTIQAFGRGTTEFLSNLTVGVAGASGTGSIVAEQLYRLGIKRLVLVDDDYVETRNLGRILNSSADDATHCVNKALMLKREYDNMGLSTEVIAVPTVIAEPETVRLLSQCDLIFGCLDSADGRMHLNRICTFYTIPYIDLGVKLKSDLGAISEISGAIRYIIPGEASMLSIGAYTLEQVESEALRRDDPIAYRERLKEKYIQGAQEGSPAVISVNMLVASLAVLEMLNRIHEYRDTPNDQVEVLTINLLEPGFPQPTPPGIRDERLAKHLGKGDCIPLLDMPGIGV